MATHYVATLKIERVEREEMVAVGSTSRANVEQRDRSIQTVASINLRADELDSLTGKLIAHIGLVED